MVCGWNWLGPGRILSCVQKLTCSSISSGQFIGPKPLPIGYIYIYIYMRWVQVARSITFVC